MAGQYPFAAAWGIFIDRVGPWACSLSAAVLYAIGFGLFSQAVSGPPGTLSIRSYHFLIIYFFLAGLATVASYFSSQFSAARIFPNRSALAIGVTTSIFGLSPLFLSLLASAFFIDPATEVVDCSRFLRFLAFATGIIHIVSGIGMRAVPPEQEHPPIIPSVEAADETPTERTALIQKPDSNSDHDKSLLALLRIPDFWYLTCAVFVCIGASEMVISNIGTILLALPSTIHSQSSPPVQVRLLSASNTLSRIFAGLFVDQVSPKSAPLKSRQIARIKLVYACALTLTLTFLWMSYGIRTQAGIWVLSVGTGVAYGATWTIVPGLVATLWGARDAGRNFGLVSYAPFLGTPVFTYLYAFVSDHARGRDTICHGVGCWQTTFRVCATAAGVAAFAALLLWRKRVIST
jgi:MFS family permease